MGRDQVETAYIQVFCNAAQSVGKLSNSVVRDRLSGKSSPGKDNGNPAKTAGENPIIKVQFNPSTLSFSTYDRGRQEREKKTTLTQSGQKRIAAAFADDPDASINVSFKLIFDRTNDEDADVQPDVERFIALVRDPYVRQAAFCWGDMSYKGVLRSVEAEYVLFNQLGIPTRATVALTLEGI